MLKILTKEYNLLSDSKIKRILCFGVPVYICLFLIIFEPFNLNLTENFYKKYLTILLYSFTGAGIWIIHLYGFFNKRKKYTIAQSILILIWIHLLIGVSNFILHEVALGHKPFVFKVLPILVLWTYLSGIIPIVFVILSYNSHLIKSKVRTVNQLNRNLSENSDTKVSKSISIVSDNESTFLNIPEDRIMYFLAAGNYVDAYYIENNNTVKHTMIRNTLSNVHLQLNKQSIVFIRCHNSYLINIGNIEKIIGNSAAYKAAIKYSNHKVPISKKYREELFRRINTE